MKGIAAAGLDGTADQLATAANPNYSDSPSWDNLPVTPLHAAYAADVQADQDTWWKLPGSREQVWEATLANLSVPGVFDAPNFPPHFFTTAGLTPWLMQEFTGSEAQFYADPSPVAGADATAAVTKAGNAQYPNPTNGNDPNFQQEFQNYQAWQNLTFMHPLLADDARMFLEYGGFATSAPQSGTVQFRVAVEDLKSRFASCEWRNPADPYGVLGQELQSAATEWQAELAGQGSQRDSIYAANLKAVAALQVGAQAMGEALGQSWIADNLTVWQNYWVHQKPGSTALYPSAADFARVKKELPAAQAAAQAQWSLAQQQDAIAQQAVKDTNTAEAAAYATADSIGAPRGRGLLSGQQEAQVTKASAAALDAIVKATQTAYQATTASAADGATLDALAQTQAHASAAAFRLAAAQEADNQAKAAAAGAALQAKNAATAAQAAQTQLTAAQNDEATAQQAAATAHAKLLAAQANQAKAATDKSTAATDQAKASQDQQTAQSDATTAQNALTAAQSAESTASAKQQAAQQADQAATTARQQAWDASQQRNALQAKADAADAYAAAQSSGSDADAARSAADSADQDAQNASDAADAATSAAADATSAAQNADAAATQAQGAASQAQANADDAASAKATADSAVTADESAAANAIADAQTASYDAQTAKSDAATAQSQADTAQAQANAAEAQAQQAQSTAANAAGDAYTTAQAATAASAAASQVAAPANDAIQLGAPYQDSDSSAGLAVLSAEGAKTIADQQQAVAQAKAAQAAEVAQEAQALANKATGDAKAAEVAAADAAAQAAQAQVSVQQALASAAQAEKYAAEAQATVPVTQQYDAQAASDAASAQAAAQAAAGDAADAKASANAAESDATAAQAAATQAQQAAATAQQVAAQADKDAAAAEAAAQDAQQQAAAVQQAATAAEQQQNATSVDNGGATGVPHMYTVQKITPVGDPQQETPCNIPPFGAGCNVTFLLTFSVTVDFYLCNDQSAPADVNAGGCPSGDSVLLDSETSQGTHEVTAFITAAQVIEGILKAVGQSLWDGLTGDITACAHGSLSGCAWTAAWLVPTSKVLNVVKLLSTLTDALKTGDGLAAAWDALEAANLLPATTMYRLQDLVAGEEAATAQTTAEIQQAVTDLTAEEGQPVTAASLQAQLAELMRRRTLGMDPDHGDEFNRPEMETALLTEALRGVRLRRAPDGGVEWFDQANNSYDAMFSDLAAQYFDRQWQLGKLQTSILDHVRKADFVPFDVRHLTADQVATLKSYVAGLTPAQQAKIFFIS